MVEVIEPGKGEVFDVELEENLLAENRRLADVNKDLFEAKGIRTFDVMGAIGSGKTTLLEHMIENLKSRYRIAVIEGDITTTIDADLIARHGVRVVQINTGKECHLDANLVGKALTRLDIDKLDLLFIENVGNLICPAEFPLGSEKRVVVTSVTEGPYIIVKHPLIFMGADVVVLNKIDLSEAMGTRIDNLRKDISNINPKAIVVPTNCRNGIGIMEVISALGLS